VFIVLAVPFLEFVNLTTIVSLLANQMQIVYNRCQMDEQNNRTPESLTRSEASTFDDDDAAEESLDTSSESSTDNGDTRRGAFDVFESSEPNDPEEPSLYDLFEQHADPEPPLESLAQDEQTLVVEQASELNLDAANQELAGTEPGSAEEAAAIAGATFNEAVKERIDNGEGPTEETLDAALTDTAEIMGLDPNQIAEEVPSEVEEVIDTELPDGPTEVPEPASPEIAGPEEELEPLAAVEDAPELDDSTNDGNTPPDDDPTIPSVPPGIPPGTPPPPGGPVPPGGPAGPAGPGGPTPPGGPGPGWTPAGGPGFGPGVAPPMPTAPWMGPGTAAALATGNALRNNRRHRHWPYVVAGGVVGYLIGRRRGRINTEKKLLPVQQKLERQVGDMQFQLALREAKIRKLAYLTAINQPHIHAALPKRLKELQELQKARIKKEDFERVDKARANLEQLNKPVTEAAAVGLAAKVAAMTERTNRHEVASAKDMELSDILRIAERLPIEDRNLRVLYESGRISQQGLRRVIEAYLRGERFDRILFEEFQKGDRTAETKLSGSEHNIETAAELPTVNETQYRASATNKSIQLPADISPEQLDTARHNYLSELARQSGNATTHEHHFNLKPVILIGVAVGLGVVALLIWG
jgi:hypothetical protein